MKRMLLFFILANCAVADIDRQDFANKLAFASKNNISNGLFSGILVIEKKGLSNAEIQNRSAAYLAKLTSDRAKGILPLTETQLQDYQTESGLSIDELKRDGIFNRQVDILIENMAVHYTNNLFHTQSNVNEKRKVSYWVGPNFQARNESTLESLSLNGAIQTDKAGNSSVTTVNREYTKTLLVQDRTGQVLKGSRERLDYYLNSGMNGFMLTKAGRPRACQYDNIVAIEEAVVNNQRIYRAIITEEIGPGISLTYLNEYFPEYGYCLKSSFVFENGEYVSSKTYDQYQEIEPGLWYPMQQTEKEYERKKLPPDIKDRLSDKNISYDELFSYISDVEALKTKSLLLDTVNLEIPMPEETFDLQFPVGTSVLDFTIPSGGNGAV
jgi:hypothetical protein